MNNISLIGNACDSPDIKEYGKGKNKTLRGTFTLAVRRPYVRDDDSQDTDFIKITAWSERAEFMEKYIEKGTRIGLTGSLRIDILDSEDDPEDEDNERTYYTNVVVNGWTFCEKAETDKKSKAGNKNKSTKKSSVKKSKYEYDEDLPL